MTQEEPPVVQSTESSTEPAASAGASAGATDATAAAAVSNEEQENGTGPGAGAGDRVSATLVGTTATASAAAATSAAAEAPSAASEEERRQAGNVNVNVKKRPLPVADDGEAQPASLEAAVTPVDTVTTGNNNRPLGSSVSLDPTTQATQSMPSSLLASSLYRMTDGIPQRELRLIVEEATLCEEALEEELRILKEALRREADAGDGEDGGGAVSSATATETETATETTTATLSMMLESEATPPDQHWTLSALLGRLRRDLTTPLPPDSQLPAHRIQAGLQHLADNNNNSAAAAATAPNNNNNKKKRLNNNNSAGTGEGGGGGPSPSPDAATAATITTTTDAGGINDGPDLVAPPASTVVVDVTEAEADDPVATAATTTSTGVVGVEGGRSTTPRPPPPLPKKGLGRDGSHFQRLSQLHDGLPDYVEDHYPNTDRLLALWKKISTHRTSLVFRRPVNPREAPGYAERILFPMDLSLMRKLIVGGVIRNYKGVAQRVHLICHNCVKYNGRESDYALVAREFETVASEYIFSAVCNHHHHDAVVVAASAVSASTSAPAADVNVGTAMPPPNDGNDGDDKTDVTGTVADARS